MVESIFVKESTVDSFQHISIIEESKLAEGQYYLAAENIGHCRRHVDVLSNDEIRAYSYDFVRRSRLSWRSRLFLSDLFPDDPHPIVIDFGAVL